MPIKGMRTFWLKHRGFSRYKSRVRTVRRYKKRFMYKNRRTVEVKFNDTGVQTVGPTSSGTIALLSQIATGTDQNTRIGISVNGKYIFVRGSMLVNATPVDTIVRILIFIDSDNQGSNPVVTDVLDSANVNSQLSSVNGDRFKMLYDKVFILDTVNTTILNYKCFRPLKNLHIKYKGTSGTQTGDNNLYILLLSNQATSVPSVTYSSRIRFTD